MKHLLVSTLAGLGVALTSACGGSGGVGVATPSSSVASPGSVPASACENAPSGGTSRVMIDWVDFVQLDGRQYLAGLDGAMPPIASNQLGAVVGRVTCQLSVLKFSKEPGPNVDGDAAFLPIGTEVRAVQGFDPSCGVAARIDGVNRVYLAHHDVGGYSKAVPCATVP